MATEPTRDELTAAHRMMTSAVEMAESIGGRDELVTWLCEKYDLHGPDKCVEYHECEVYCEHEDAEPVDMDELRALARQVHDTPVTPGGYQHDVGTYATCSRETCQRFARILGDR